MAPQSIINEPDLALDQYDSNIFVITMRKAPENRINSAYAQKLIAAYNTVRKILGEGSEGAVITRGNDAKFWCTVSGPNNKSLPPCMAEANVTYNSGDRRPSLSDVDDRAWNWTRPITILMQIRKGSSRCSPRLWTFLSQPLL